MVEKKQIEKLLSDIKKADELRQTVAVLGDLISNHDKFYEQSVSLNIKYRKVFNDRDKELNFTFGKNKTLCFVEHVKEFYENMLKPYEQMLEGLSVINTNGF